MENIVCYWDSDTHSQHVRPMTPAEIVQRDADIAAAVAPVVPATLPMLNVRLALIRSGHMATVKSYVDVLPGVEGEQARAYLEYAQNVRRDHALVEGIRLKLALTHADMDALFISAASLA